MTKINQGTETEPEPVAGPKRRPQDSKGKGGKSKGTTFPTIFFRVSYVLMISI